MAAAHASEKTNRLKEHAEALGCSELIRLDAEATPFNLEYLDLLPGKFDAPVMPDAVAEFQGKPLLYLVDAIDEDGESTQRVQEVQDLQTLLANRGEHACLGLVKPGSLDIYPINLDRKTLAHAHFRTIHIAQPGAASFFQSLAMGTVDLPGRPTQADYVLGNVSGGGGARHRRSGAWFLREHTARSRQAARPVSQERRQADDGKDGR